MKLEFVPDPGRAGGEVRQGVEQARLEGSGAVRYKRGDLSRSPEVRQGAGHGLYVPPADGGETAHDGGRGAAAPDDAAHERMPVFDGQRAGSVADVVRLPGGGDGNTEGAGGRFYGRGSVARQALDAAHFGGEAGEGRYLAGVAADGGDLQLRQ